MIDTSQLPDTPSEYFCIAPFQSTRQNAHGRVSPCAFGAGEWRHGHLTPAERWVSPELNALRQEFIDGKKPTACQRCWAEEDAGKESLRQRQLKYFPNDYQNFVRSQKWHNGPKTAVFKTSDVCNLTCRSCGGYDTNLYDEEGRYYLDHYKTTTVINGEIKKYNRFMAVTKPKHLDFMAFKDIAVNLEKIDFFGGEPFLNITQLDLLEYLTEKGLSKNITLFYSTNCTNYPTPRLLRAWNEFKRVEISMSIDGTEERFEYMRYPGKWDQAYKVIRYLQDLNNQLDCEVYHMAGLTFSLLNMYDGDNIYNWLKEEIGDVYINMVSSPSYLSLHTAPENVKSIVKQHIKHPEILGYIDIAPSDPLLWKQFLIWTKRQDLYRNQQYSLVYPDFFEIIEDDWNAITNLSEENFNRL